jgi:RNA polymerase sigma-70 factor (sigma-E family)
MDDAFTDFVVARWARLVRSAVFLGCSTAEAEDVVQTTLEKCLASWSRVERAGDRDAYVYRVLVNTFRRSRRRRWTGERPTGTLPDHVVPDPTAGVDDMDAITRALARLTDDQRAAVTLRFYAGLDERQMAEALGVAAGTVKSRLSRALGALAQDPTLEELRGLR